MTPSDEPRRRHTDVQLKKLILGAARDAAKRFAYYDRKEDEDLTADEIVDAVRRGVVSVDELAAEFQYELVTWARLRVSAPAPRKRARR